ncbi:ArsA-related P-loop ATPase [Streptomyces sp. NPDC007861]|uniref:ArsA family ATPase n=1 Tax=Streptomyces sp. NPDC007861 TaxID=3154893 RepID=UPI0033C17715
MRTVLVTGPGGSGRTTVAAATALAEARRGRRTLLLSGEAGGVLGTAVGTEPRPVTDGLWAVRTDPGAHFRSELLAFQERGSALLDLLGARGLEDEELTELPGSEQSALLRALRDAAAGGWDVLVVDLPPVPDAIALLGLPEQLRRYLRRLVPAERQAARALRPVLAQLAGVPMPAQWLYDTAARWEAELAAVQGLIEDRNTTVRLVAEPGPAGEDALRTARLGLALYRADVDTLVANRVLPVVSGDPWLAGLQAQQDKALRGWHEEWARTAAVREAAHLGRDPRGLDDLAALDLPVGPPAPREPWGVVEGPAGDEGTLVWQLPLPGAVKEELHLVRRGDELVLTAGPFRRIVPLPSALRRCTVSGAGLTDGVLGVRFTPDPALWPRTH